MSTPIIPASSETLPRPPAKKLPEDSEIDNFSPATPGWVVYYFQSQISRVVGLPVAVWALVTYTEKVSKQNYRGQAEMFRQEIRHFVVTDSGACVDYLDIPNDFLCVIGPMIPNHQEVIMQHLAERGLQIEGAQKSEN